MAGYCVGVDGCRKGWVSVALRDLHAPHLMVHEDMHALWREHDSADIILIDMPIGLLESGVSERECEYEARRLLGTRRSSVFPVPCRDAVYAARNEEAMAVNLERTGRQLSLQSLAIRGKIRQVDELLRKDERARRLFKEVHPELLFCGMNNGYAMLHHKKGRPGRLERLSLLSEIAGERIVDAVMAQAKTYRRRDLAWDDIIDALAAAVAASHPKELLSIPENPPLDAHGLPMQMVYLQRSSTRRTQHA